MDSGGRTYEDVRANERTMLMMLNDPPGCCGLKLPRVEIKLGQAC